MIYLVREVGSLKLFLIWFLKILIFDLYVVFYIYVFRKYGLELLTLVFIILYEFLFNLILFNYFCYLVLLKKNYLSNKLFFEIYFGRVFLD